MPKYLVTWSANLVLESEVTAKSKEEAERMAMNNDISIKEAFKKECEPNFAQAIEITEE